MSVSLICLRVSPEWSPSAAGIAGSPRTILLLRFFQSFFASFFRKSKMSSYSCAPVMSRVQGLGFRVQGLGFRV